MKTDFNLNVSVNVDVAPGLADLLTRMCDFFSVHTPQLNVGFSAEAATGMPTATVTQTEAPEPEAPAKPLTAEDVRTAMHRTRQRIEGEDYKNNTDSEAYVKYHRALTAEFKNIASLLGAEKPSLIPEEHRAAFVAACEGLRVKEDGTIGQEAPF